MNRKIKSLLITALAFSLQNIGAYTNKTFLQPRNQALTNLPFEMTSFYERTSAKRTNHCGFNLEAVGFYGESTNKTELGQYFGFKNKNTITLERSQNPQWLENPDGFFDIGYLIHDTTASPAGWTDLPHSLISLRPKSVHYGVDFVYYQELPKRWFFKINVPVECVQNNPHLSIVGGDPATIPAPGHLATKANILNFFQGNAIEGQPVNNQQLPLTAGKIHGRRSATGVADIDVMVGYRFLNEEAWRASFNIGVNIPTGKKATGKYMFEPIYGTVNVGLGCGVDASGRVWGNDHENFKINLAVNYRYFFKGSEHRIPGIDRDNFGQYELLAKANATVADPIILQPAANILNQKVNVKLGSQFEGLLGLAYNKGGLTLDIGYNIYHREGEKVSATRTTFTPSTYGTASKGLILSGATSGATTAVGIQPADALSVVFGSPVQGESQFDVTNDSEPAWLRDFYDLSLGAAATPSQLTNSIYAGAGYAFKEWRCPLMLGIGGKYEFASRNSSLEIWQINAKAGLSF